MLQDFNKCNNNKLMVNLLYYSDLYSAESPCEFMGQCKITVNYKVLATVTVSARSAEV